mmetsp:Transcript_24248/g.51473  ORF Transcript_24248/g.51473 Transcript_24248/m.51473 type:complete len:213 (-) Transcript_24248:80-718(-)
MLSEDPVLVGLSIILGLLTLLLGSFVAREVLCGVWHVEAAVHGALQCAPHPGTHACGLEAHIEDHLQGLLLSLLVLHMVLLAIDLLLALEILVEAELLQHTARHQEACAVSRGVVLVTDGDAKVLELGGTGRSNNDVPADCGVGDLADAPPVGEAHDKAVLPVVVLALVLAAHLPACLEVRLALATTALRHLEALEVGGVLENLDERHGASS